MWMQTFFRDISPILIAVIIFIIIFIALTKLKMPVNGTTIAILSLLIALVLFASKRVTSYLISLVPFLIVLLALSFFIILLLAFVVKDIGVFGKILAWLGFFLAILLCLGFAFDQFPTLNHMLPNTSDSYLSPQLEDVKDTIYSRDFKEGFLFVAVVAIVFFVLVKK